VVQRLFYEARHPIFIAGHELIRANRFFGRWQIAWLRSRRCRYDFASICRPAAGSGEAAANQVFLAEFQKSNWPAGCPVPAFYYDPRTIIPRPALQHRLHAKCVVVDGEQAFISSAKFTEAAHERNIEVGVLLRSCPSAQRLVEFFEHLIRAGYLLQIPV
jgi:phosphatidylserine/phosphatidylglycerophosphate/cardiolipin synthase-like enzyme